MAVKLDIKKAYDKFEWPFIEKCLIQLGFPMYIVRPLTKCITSLSYSILVNGVEQEIFFPSRGLRQGDPLTSLIEDKVNRDLIRGVNASPSGIRVSHLLFADDRLAFIHASRSDCVEFLDILHSYQLAAGQEVNFNKSSVYFSSNVLDSLKLELQQVLGTDKCLTDSNYLGMPILLGRNRKASFEYLRDRIQSKLEGWKGRLLSASGKEIWRCTAQSSYGILIMELGKPIGLLGEDYVLKGKYFRITSFKKASLVSNPSALWRAFLDAREILLKGGRWRVGNGANIEIYNDKSVANLDNYQIQPITDFHDVHLTVASLVNSHEGVWKRELLNSMFSPSQVAAILATPLSLPLPADRFIWMGTLDGKYTVQSGYYVAKDVLMLRKNLSPIISLFLH
ncbi:uncharacterized protein [Rutidosis leptorrhynchoides]|uniref:uncharacterized protein n=1 Tax=Rutidosis leptorrhynchoides TaxID=125765 RepID=UPI003A99D66B